MTASTQNQALSALLSLSREVFAIDMPWMEAVTRAKRAERLPVVMTGTEVKAVLYGAGLRLMQCVRLRVLDLDPRARQLIVRDRNYGGGRVRSPLDR